MLNDLDDLFRQELDGHASEPGADLWARLQARTQAEANPAADAHPVDDRFRAGLAGHATPPRRALWERLEDEHLRPRQRRRPVVGWGRLAVAASLLLLLLGGAGVWWGSQPSPPAGVATTGVASQAGSAARHPATALPVARPVASSRNAHIPAQQVAVATPPLGAALAATKTASHAKNQQFFASRATGPAGLASSGPVASSGRPRRAAAARVPAARLPQPAPLPDAATGPELARAEERNPSASQPKTPTLAAASPQVIEVEVRRGTLARPPADAVAAAPETPAAPRRRFRLGGVLREAGHALHGEPVNLAEATGLPESLTLQARLGDRVVAKTIRL